MLIHLEDILLLDTYSAWYQTDLIGLFDKFMMRWMSKWGLFYKINCMYLVCVFVYSKSFIVDYVRSYVAD